MHSSRMCTTNCSGHLSCHACPPCHTHPNCQSCPPYHACSLPCMPPAMYSPHHASLPGHTCPSSHACPLPCIPPTMQASLATHAPPAMHVPPATHPPWTDRHLWKHNLRKLCLRAVIIKKVILSQPGSIKISFHKKKELVLMWISS